MILPTSTSGKFAAFLFAIFLVALNPPVVTAVSNSTPFVGFVPLYLWFVSWGVVAFLVLVWAARRDAFGLTEDQVPSDLTSTERTTLDPGSDLTDSRVD